LSEIFYLRLEYNVDDEQACRVAKSILNLPAEQAAIGYIPDRIK
jgi:hypothetical protein